MEVWRSIPGYEFCEVSNIGRVRTIYPYLQREGSSNYGKPPRVHVLSPSLNQGYHGVNVHKTSFGRRVQTTVHRLVALAFLGEPPEGAETVNHKNFIRNDNRVENLEWLSLADNSRHAAQYSPTWHHLKRRGSKKIDPSHADLEFISTLLARGANPNNLKRIFLRIE